MDRYSELYNEIEGNHCGMAASIFKIRLPVGSELRKSLTKNLAEDMHGLMEQLEEYIKVGRLLPQARLKGKSVVIERKEGRMDLPPSRLRRDFFPL